jgi:hypothetical protein
MKNENYILIQGWMVNELKLNGTKLLIYAIIYGFSQDGESHFEGSLKHLQTSTGKGRSAVMNALKSLTEEDGFLVKTIISRNGITFNKYRHSLNAPFGNQTTPRSESEPPPVRKVNGGGVETKPNNSTYNLFEKTIRKERKIFLPWDTPDFVKAWELWKKYKKEEKNFRFKSEISEQAALKGLSEMTNHNEQEAIKAIHTAIEKGWAGLFKIKNQKNGSGSALTEDQQSFLADQGNI